MTTTPKRRFFSGSSLESALVAAASEYGIPVEEISYKEIEKRHGFLRVRRNVVIEVDPESPRRPQGEKAAKIAPVPERRTPPPLGGPEEKEEASAPEGVESSDDSPARPRRRRGAPPRPAVTAPVEVDEDEYESRDEADFDGPDDKEGDDREDPDTEDRPRRRRASAPSQQAPSRRSRRDEDGEDEGGGRRRSRRRSRPRRAPRERKELLPIEERLEEARGDEADSVTEAMEWLLDLVDLDVDPKVFAGEERYEVELRGDDRDVLVSEDGKVLTAIEHLLPRVLHGVHGEALPVRVDSENFQEGREERLRDTAYRMAEEVRASGMPEVLEPMDPADRRIVHLALGDEPEVDTKSLGNGFYKRVKIVPVQD